MTASISQGVCKTSLLIFLNKSCQFGIILIFEVLIKEFLDVKTCKNSVNTDDHEDLRTVIRLPLHTSEHVFF